MDSTPKSFLYRMLVKKYNILLSTTVTTTLILHSTTLTTLILRSTTLTTTLILHSTITTQILHSTTVNPTLILRSTAVTTLILHSTTVTTTVTTTLILHSTTVTTTLILQSQWLGVSLEWALNSLCLLMLVNINRTVDLPLPFIVKTAIDYSNSIIQLFKISRDMPVATVTEIKLLDMHNHISIDFKGGTV